MLVLITVPLILLVLLISVIVLLAVAWAGSERAIRPQRVVEEYVPEDFGLSVEHVRFRSRDGVDLAGWLVPGTSSVTVILAHGYGRSKGELLPHAAYLHSAGYTVLLMDFRGRGESAGNDITFGAGEQLDVLAAVDFVKRHGKGPIAVMGVSLGAAAAILAAAQCPDIRAVISEGTFADLRSMAAHRFYRYTGLSPFPFAPISVWIAERRVGTRVDNISPQRAISAISPRAVFIIHGLEDEDIAPDAAQALYQAAGDPKELWLIPGIGHARGIRGAPKEYPKRVLDFLARYLR